VAVARELTKVHEEVVRGTLAEALRYYEEHTPRGEVTLVVEAMSEATVPDAADRRAATTLGQSLIDEGLKPSHAAREVARRLGLPRNLAYEIVQNLAVQLRANPEGQ
jgi:16S rRNA (cytidine1402-2'-O)-methyltransferase